MDGTRLMLTRMFEPRENRKTYFLLHVLRQWQKCAKQRTREQKRQLLPKFQFWGNKHKEDIRFSCKHIAGLLIQTFGCNDYLLAQVQRLQERTEFSCCHQITQICIWSLYICIYIYIYISFKCEDVLQLRSMSQSGFDKTVTHTQHRFELFSPVQVGLRQNRVNHNR